MTKMEIINDMVNNGYCLMNRTKEEMCEMFSLETLMDFRNNFFQHIGKEV